ncbi:MAG: hypothetical protein M3P48_10195 [Actinomycetota bacterium]|nr:hypothetical protein [Actinomycetota bacterium]
MFEPVVQGGDVGCGLGRHALACQDFGERVHVALELGGQDRQRPPVGDQGVQAPVRAAGVDAGLRCQVGEVGLDREQPLLGVAADASQRPSVDAVQQGGQGAVGHPGQRSDLTQSDPAGA